MWYLFAPYPQMVFAYGSVPLKTYLPDGDVDLTVLGNTSYGSTLIDDIYYILQSEEQCYDAEFEVKDLQLINAEKLGQVLLLQSELIPDEIYGFFKNTLNRIGSGVRPDIGNESYDDAFHRLLSPSSTETDERRLSPVSSSHSTEDFSQQSQDEGTWSVACHQDFTKLEMKITSHLSVLEPTETFGT
ncbi:hypothetical protein E2562_023751 [Oryza meyeriana var. granulata]|uniref:Polymerase nucleotidyl transferase domain-containing protein n=1 Tax=Oryza meyeriana var. granulata TaxID=110450 RepID=A0A6G1DMC4_9ORYZ|nr:hypothetical protein E2562_023751 [Oryza meyeriana var. granulata]